MLSWGNRVPQLRLYMYAGLIFLGLLNFGRGDEVGRCAVVLGEKSVPNTRLLELEDQSRLRFNIEDKSVAMEFGDVCRFGVHPYPQRFPLVVFVDGSYLSITSIERDKNQFVLQTNLWEQIRVPDSMLRGIVVGPMVTTDAWYALLDRICHATGRNDQLLLSSRGWTEGILQWPDAKGELLLPEATQKLRMSSGEGEILVKDIEAVIFSPVLTPMTNQKSFGRIGWKDGSVLACSQWRIVQPGDFLELTLRCGVTLKSLDQPAVVAQSIVSLSHRPRTIVYLSDLEVSSYKHVDWLTSKWPFAKDRDLYGRRLMTKSGVVEKGLAMHATSQAAFRWDKSPGNLVASLVLALPAESGLPAIGQAIVKVMGLKDGKLEMLYTSELISASQAAQDLSVSLEGVELIVLIVDAGPAGTLGDHVLWLDARIHK